jgi:hypothetical protein
MSTLTTYPLRLPKSVQAEAEALSKADGTSLNQFVAIAVAEKIAVLKTAAFFEERRKRSTGKALDALLSRRGGEPPREGDELPDGYVPVAARQGVASKSAVTRKSTASRRPAKKKS